MACPVRTATAQWRTGARAHTAAPAPPFPQGRAVGGRRARRRAGAQAQAALDTSNQLHVYKYRYKTRFFVLVESLVDRSTQPCRPLSSQCSSRRWSSQGERGRQHHTVPSIAIASRCASRILQPASKMHPRTRSPYQLAPITPCVLQAEQGCMVLRWQPRWAKRPRHVEERWKRSGGAHPLNPMCFACLSPPCFTSSY